MHKARQRRRESAARLVEARAKRTDREQLTLINARPGESAKERARLEARIANPPQTGVTRKRTA
jgi:hypothetical protein